MNPLLSNPEIGAIIGVCLLFILAVMWVLIRDTEDDEQNPGGSWWM